MKEWSEATDKWDAAKEQLKACQSEINSLKLDRTLSAGAAEAESEKAKRQIEELQQQVKTFDSSTSHGTNMADKLQEELAKANKFIEDLQ